MAINVHSLRVSNMTVGPLSGGSGGGGGASFVTTNLLGHWDMGDSSSWGGSGTTVNDLSGLGRNATFLSTPTTGGSGASTHVTSGYLETSMISNRFGLPVGSTLTMTYSHWFRINGNTGFEKFSEFQRGTDGGILQLINYYTNGSIRVVGMGTEHEINNFHTTHGTNWVNIAVSANSGNFSVYVNGSLDGTFSSSRTISSITDGIAIHTNKTNIHWAQTAVYSVALSASQISGNFDALKSRYGY